jgi:hypothetical protein
MLKHFLFHFLIKLIIHFERFKQIKATKHLEISLEIVYLKLLFIFFFSLYQRIFYILTI